MEWTRRSRKGGVIWENLKCQEDLRVDQKGVYTIREGLKRG